MLLLRARGLAPTASIALLFDLFGAHGDYGGEGTYLEAASGWIALPGLGLALAAVLTPAGPLARRALIVPVGIVAFLLTLEVPGVLDLYRRLPLVGLGATERVAPVAALFAGLLAAEALQAAPRVSRIAAAATLLLLIGGAARAPEAGAVPDALRVPPPRTSSSGCSSSPARTSQRRGASRAGCTRAFRSRRSSCGSRGSTPAARRCPSSASTLPVELAPAPSDAARTLAPDAVAAAPAGARFFRASYLVVDHMPDGLWRLAVDVFGPDSAERPIATRPIVVGRVVRPRRASAWTFAFAGLTLLLLAASGPARRGALPLAFCAVAGAQALVFAAGANPAVPRAESFPETRTEAVLAEILGPHRFFSEPYVLPPDTGLVRGLRGLDGYDGMDVARYNAYRSLAVRPGANALLAWHARGVDLSAPAFRLFGVGALVLGGPLEEPGWELVAAPERAGRRDLPLAETYVYRALDPLPRAFCVPAVVSNDELGALYAAGAWDPLAVASLEADWRPASPYTEARVGVPAWTNNTVTVDVELDGRRPLGAHRPALPRVDRRDRRRAGRGPRRRRHLPRRAARGGAARGRLPLRALARARGRRAVAGGPARDLRARRGRTAAERRAVAATPAGAIVGPMTNPVPRAVFEGMQVAERRFRVPLDHARPSAGSIEIFAREVVAVDRRDEALPWLVFLQGGPGCPAPRPVTLSGWIARAAERFRILLLDQRGTGCSTPLSAASLRHRSPAEQARHLALFRADAIVADCERIRGELTGGEPGPCSARATAASARCTTSRRRPRGSPLRSSPAACRRSSTTATRSTGAPIRASSRATVSTASVIPRTANACGGSSTCSPRATCASPPATA